MSIDKIFVLIPAVSISSRAGKFNKPYSAFHQAAGNQALFGKGLGVFEGGIQAIQLFGGLRFSTQIGQFRHRTLHEVGSLVVTDGCLYLWVTL